MENEEQPPSRAALPKVILDELAGLNDALRQAAEADKARLVDLRHDVPSTKTKVRTTRSKTGAPIGEVPAAPAPAEPVVEPVVERVAEPVAELTGAAGATAPWEALGVSESDAATLKNPNLVRSTLGGADPSLVPAGWHLGLAPRRPVTRMTRAKRWLRRNWPFFLASTLAAIAIIVALMIRGA